uniref:Uncharacterized protein n=1 Tax=Schistosoma haematobium TaxID=6185 RepID=A0A094ZIG3_SCHHA
MSSTMGPNARVHRVSEIKECMTLIHIILNCLQNNEDLSHAGSIYVAVVKLTDCLNQ